VRPAQSSRNRVIQGPSRRSAIVGLASLLSLVGALRSAKAQGRPAGIIDTHLHIERDPRRRENLEAAIVLRALDSFSIEKAILTPPPLPPGRVSRYGLNALRAIAGQQKQRLAFMAGGDTLNPIIQETPRERVSSDVLRRFTELAETIAQSGAVGFSELAVEHFSSNRGAHPYESSPPDHPLFLALADIAAKHAMPIEIHMEAVPDDMSFPEIGRKGGRNPETLHANIAALGRLLDHNSQARIVWVHAGWDLIGERTVPLMRRLLHDHTNLLMSIKIEGGHLTTQPMMPDGGIKPGWIAMLRDFPDRFVIGSDTFIAEGPEPMEAARRFVDALPSDLVAPIARENALRLYRLS
jgi:predicted TIM-barrel fold metal-dependent hydrolase